MTESTSLAEKFEALRPVLSELARRRWAATEALACGELLHGAGSSLQGTRKTREGAQHPDRNAQFEHIAARGQDCQDRGEPVISVDAKKKELIDDFKNGGHEWPPQGQAPQVRVYDCVDPVLGKALPYGVDDLHANVGWVSVGVDHDTPAFAVATMRAWWLQMGTAMYPKAKALLITADSGGSNSARARLWKRELQGFADDSGLRVSVSHLPPGPSKWNKIEHRMCCHITATWRGQPLESREIMVSLMGGTTTAQGLRIQAILDAGLYPTGVKVSEAEMQALRIKRAAFHGDWNYTILPHRRSKTKRSANV